MKRTSLLALGAFVALLAVYLLTRESNPSAGTKRLDLTGIVPAKVTALALSGPQSASLHREGDGWKLGDKPADGALVDNALEALSKVKTTEVVTERPEKHADYEVDSAKALKLKLTREGAEPLELWIGKTARNGGVYVRRPSEDTVFVASGGLSWQLHREGDQWRKKSFVPFKADEVSELTVKPAGAVPYTLKKDGAAWKLESPSPVPAAPGAPPFRFDANAASRIASQLASMNAQEFGDHLPDDVAALTDVVVAKLSSGKTVAVHFGVRPDPFVRTAATELRAQFDAVDGAGTKDDRITREELAKVAADATKPESVRKVAERLKDDAATFRKLDVGVYAMTAKDDALTRGDLDAATRTLNLVPVRVDGDSQLYLVPTFAADGALKRLDELRDLTLFDFDPQKVSRVDLHSGATHVTVAKDGASWKVVEPKKLPDGFEFDPSSVPLQLASFKAIRAIRVLDGAAVVPDAQAGLTAPAASLEVTVDGGAKQTLKLGKAVAGRTAGELYARGAVDDGLYAVSANEKARLDRGLELFKKRPPPPSFAGGGNGLDQLPPDVRRQLEASLRSHANPQ